MAKKRLSYLFYFNDNIAGKDMFLVPMYLAEQIGAEAEIVFPKWEDNKHLTGYYRGVKLTPIKSDSRFHSTFWSERAMTWWLIKNARKTDVLFLFWINKRNILYSLLYKMLNPKGISYIKADGAPFVVSKETLVKRIKCKILDFLYRYVDIVSVETESLFDNAQKGCYGNLLKGKTLLVSNAFDYKMFDELNITKKNFGEKENIIITVGRIGDYYKNSEFMLEVLDGLSLGDWEFHFIGPVEQDFIPKYEAFCKRNPDSASKVKLIGGIYDRRKLWEQYNKAKVFVLTSRKEGMACVYSEALAFGDYIVTTDVSSAEDITDHQRVGTIIAQGDAESFRRRLRYIMDNQDILENNVPEAMGLSEKKYNWSVQVKKVADRIKEIWGNA